MHSHSDQSTWAAEELEIATVSMKHGGTGAMLHICVMLWVQHMEEPPGLQVQPLPPHSPHVNGQQNVL